MAYTHPYRYCKLQKWLREDCSTILANLSQHDGISYKESYFACHLTGFTQSRDDNARNTKVHTSHRHDCLRFLGHQSLDRHPFYQLSTYMTGGAPTHLRTSHGMFSQQAAMSHWHKWQMHNFTLPGGTMTLKNPLLDGKFCSKRRHLGNRKPRVRTKVPPDPMGNSHPKA